MVFYKWDDKTIYKMYKGYKLRVEKVNYVTENSDLKNE